MPTWAVLTISAVSDFVITAGTAYTTVASGGTAIPTKTQVVVCIVGGLVQAARGIQKSLAPAVR
jgi:hypothetical protein